MSSMSVTLGINLPTKEKEDKYTLCLSFKPRAPRGGGGGDSHIKRTRVLFFTITQNKISQLLFNVNYYLLFIIRWSSLEFLLLIEMQYNMNP